MTEAELREYHTIITDCWQLFKKYSTPSADEKFWTALAAEVNILYEKYESNFAEDIALAVMNEIERRYKIWEVAI